MKITKKKIAWGIVLLILIAGGVICKIRWKVWLHNIPEIRYVLTEDPQRVFLTFGNDGELSRNVSWVCGGVSKQAKLEYTKIGSEILFSLTALPNFSVHWAGSVMPTGQNLKNSLMAIPTLIGYGMTIAHPIGIRSRCNPIRLIISPLYL
ncbi:hypothetical protein NXY28_24040 [Bacteroides thetaiotaomicron]|nr:hypothetical protein NXY28_24040 [Bacteroides thetaiotaomicron]